MLTLLTVVFGTAWGGTITFADLGLENGQQYSDPFDGGDFTVTFVGGANDGKYYNTGSAIRVYGNGSMIVAAKSGNLKKVVITFFNNASNQPESADIVDTGTYDLESHTWTGQAASVTFTRPTGSGHWRIQAVEATVEAGAVVEKQTPTMSFSPASLTITKGESFTEPTLSYNGDGAITYSIDNSIVGTIDASTGKLNITGIGNAIVTATAAETANFKRGTASYSLTVNAGETPDEGESIVFAELGLENSVQYTEPFDGGSFTVTFAGGSNDGKYYNTGQGIRVYGNGTMTVAAKSGNLTKVIVTFAEGATYRPEGADVVDCGIFDPGTGEWTGEAPSVTFTRPTGNGHWRVQKVAAVINGTPTPATLKIMGRTPFTGSTTVTITPSNPDFAVYYTTDGSDPTTNPTVYSAPFTITETTTVKAVEEDYSGNMSAVVEKTFVKEEAPDVPAAADIAAFKALADGTEAALTLSNAQVLYVGTNDIYVRDASGAIDFYSTGLSLSNGQVLNGSVIGKRATYNKIPELAKTEGTNASSFTATAGTAAPKVLSVAQAKDEKYFCDLIRIEGVKVVSKKEGNYTNIYAYVGNDSIWIYDRFKVGLGDWNENDTYNVEGILVPYNGFYEIYVTQPLAGGTTPDPGVTVCNDIAAFKALETGAEAKLMLNNAQVLYVGTNDIYVRDNSGAIDFYQTGLSLSNGQVLNGSVIGKRATYNKIPELAKTDKTNADGITATAGTAAPKVVSVAQAKDEKYFCDLIRIQGVKVVSKKEGNYTNIYAYVGNDSIWIYDRFKVGMGDWNENDTYDVEGILVPYSGFYEIYVTQPLTSGTTPDPGITVCNDIAAYKALESGTEAKLMLNNAQVLYAKDRDVFVRDASGAIEFFNLGIEFANGQILNGSISGKYSPYNNLPELAKTDKTNADGITFAEGTATPVKVAFSELFDSKYLCDFVEINAPVQLQNIDGKIYAVDGSAQMQIYDKFKIIEGELADGMYNVNGILVVYKNDNQLYPISVTQASGISDIVADDASNAPAYNLSGQLVGKGYKGIVIQNGRKYIRK